MNTRQGRDRVAVRAQAIGADRSRDVLECLLADILKEETDLSGGIFLHALRHAYPTRVGDPLQPGSDVDPIAVDIPILLDDVADIDANTEFDLPVLIHIRIPLTHAGLHVHGAVDGIDHTGEIGHQTVAGVLENPAPMSGN